MGVTILGNNLVTLSSLAAARSAQDPDNGQLGLAQGGLINVGSLLQNKVYLILQWSKYTDRKIQDKIMVSDDIPIEVKQFLFSYLFSFLMLMNTISNKML